MPPSGASKVSVHNKLLRLLAASLAALASHVRHDMERATHHVDAVEVELGDAQVAYEVLSLGATVDPVVEPAAAAPIGLCTAHSSPA